MAKKKVKRKKASRGGGKRSTKGKRGRRRRKTLTTRGGGGGSDIFLDPDYVGLTSTHADSYPEPPLDSFNSVTKHVYPEPGTNVNEANRIVFQFKTSPTELVRFSNEPFSLKLRLKCWGAQAELGAGGDRHWTGWIGEDDDGNPLSPYLLPGLELNTFFESIKVYVDGWLVESHLDDQSHSYHQLTRLFSDKSKEHDQLPLIKNTKEFQTKDANATVLEQLKRNCQTETEATDIVFRRTWPGQFPIQARSATCLALSKEEGRHHWIHPNAVIRVELLKRADWRSMLLWPDLHYHNARYGQPVAAAHQATLYGRIEATITGLTLCFESWTPASREEMREYQRAGTNEYLVDTPHVITHCLTPGASQFSHSLSIPDNTKTAYLYFVTNEEMRYDPGNRSQFISPMFCFPQELSNLQIKLNGRKILSEDGFRDMGKPGRAFLDESCQNYVKFLTSRRLWNDSNPTSIFPRSMGDRYRPCCQAICFDLVGLKLPHGEASEILVTGQMDAGGLRRPYNLIFMPVLAQKTVCIKGSQDPHSGNNSYRWEIDSSNKK